MWSSHLSFMSVRLIQSQTGSGSDSSSVAQREKAAGRGKTAHQNVIPCSFSYSGRKVYGCNLQPNHWGPVLSHWPDMISDVAIVIYYCCFYCPFEDSQSKYDVISQDETSL